MNMTDLPSRYTRQLEPKYPKSQKMRVRLTDLPSRYTRQLEPKFPKNQKSHVHMTDVPYTSTRQLEPKYPKSQKHTDAHDRRAFHIYPTAGAEVSQKSEKPRTHMTDVPSTSTRQLEPKYPKSQKRHGRMTDVPSTYTRQLEPKYPESQKRLVHMTTQQKQTGILRIINISV